MENKLTTTTTSLKLNYKYPDEDRANKSEEFVWCDKVGGKVKWFGRCSEYSRENLYDETHLSSRKIRLTATDYRKKKSRDRKIQRINIRHI